MINNRTDAWKAVVNLLICVAGMAHVNGSGLVCFDTIECTLQSYKNHCL